MLRGVLLLLRQREDVIPLIFMPADFVRHVVGPIAGTRKERDVLASAYFVNRRNADRVGIQFLLPEDFSSVSIEGTMLQRLHSCDGCCRL